MTSIHYLLMVLIMIGITMALRFLPFIVFSGSTKTPPYVEYLGRVLPFAIMGMLVVYCLRATPVLAAPHGVPELIAIAIVVGLQVWKRSTLVSILVGTVCYMLMVQLLF